MANNSNLRPFPKGTSGNPAGRPKGLSLVAELRKELAKKAHGTNIPLKTMVAARLVQMALAGDVPAIKVCFEYVDGKPAQPVEHSGEIDMTLTTAREVLRVVGGTGS